MSIEPLLIPRLKTNLPQITAGIHNTLVLALNRYVQTVACAVLNISTYRQFFSCGVIILSYYLPLYIVVTK